MINYAVLFKYQIINIWGKSICCDSVTTLIQKSVIPSRYFWKILLKAAYFLLVMWNKCIIMALNTQNHTSQAEIDYFRIGKPTLAWRNHKDCFDEQCKITIFNFGKIILFFERLTKNNTLKKSWRTQGFFLCIIRLGWVNWLTDVDRLKFWKNHHVLCLFCRILLPVRGHITIPQQTVKITFPLC